MKVRDVIKRVEQEEATSTAIIDGWLAHAPMALAEEYLRSGRRPPR